MVEFAARHRVQNMQVNQANPFYFMYSVCIYDNNTSLLIQTILPFIHLIQPQTFQFPLKTTSVHICFVTLGTKLKDPVVKLSFLSYVFTKIDGTPSVSPKNNK